jgi:cleavage and polyadenylation specificity factor subunit 3
MGVLDVKETAEHELTLEWESSASNDMIADSTLALITGVDKSPASVKCKHRLCLTRALVALSPLFDARR